jgi:hypothetical protein
MTSDDDKTSPTAPRSHYPVINDSDRSLILEKLAQVVSLLHPEGLSENQLREIAGSLAIQTANTERLHRFALTNAMEPAYFIQLYSGASDDE